MLVPSRDVLFHEMDWSLPCADSGSSICCENVNEELKFVVRLELNSDQGPNFESKLFQDLCKLLMISKIRTTPMHPQSNWMVERFNRTLVKGLANVTSTHQRDWDVQIPHYLWWPVDLSSTTQQDTHQLATWSSMPHLKLKSTGQGSIRSEGEFSGIPSERESLVLQLEKDKRKIVKAAIRLGSTPLSRNWWTMSLTECRRTHAPRQACKVHRGRWSVRTRR